jgi:signal transduction histidine kinase
MRSPLRSLRFCQIVLPLALLVLWRALALTAAIYDARVRVAAEVNASSALAHALVKAALQNAAKASGPASAWKDVEQHLPSTRPVITREKRDAKGDILRVVVADNGRGFSEATRFGTGPSGMSARVRDVGGGIAVSSQPGHGVSIDAFVPFLAQAGAA